MRSEPTVLVVRTILQVGMFHDVGAPGAEMTPLYDGDYVIYLGDISNLRSVFLFNGKVHIDVITFKNHGIFHVVDDTCS